MQIMHLTVMCSSGLHHCLDVLQFVVGMKMVVVVVVVVVAVARLRRLVVVGQTRDNSYVLIGFQNIWRQRTF
jgi:hypothetical protein